MASQSDNIPRRIGIITGSRTLPTYNLPAITRVWRNPTSVAERQYKPIIKKCIRRAAANYRLVFSSYVSRTMFDTLIL